MTSPTCTSRVGMPCTSAASPPSASRRALRCTGSPCTSPMAKIASPPLSRCGAGCQSPMLTLTDMDPTCSGVAVYPSRDGQRQACNPSRPAGFLRVSTICRVSTILREKGMADSLWTRRHFLVSTALAGGAAASLRPLGAEAQTVGGTLKPAAGAAGGVLPVELSVNVQPHQLLLDPRLYA